MDGDGVAETRSVFKDGLNSPFGMALVGSTLYIANTDAVVRLPYSAGDTRSDAEPVEVADLPAGTINHHWTKGLVASLDGKRLYVSVGSNSNIAERGMDKEVERAAIWEIDAATGEHRVFASGLRNPVGMTWVPQTGALWVAVNERDELGSDLVPDYMTAVVDGGFYGYKVIFVPFRDGRPAGEAQDVLTGFLDDEGRAMGRPVGVAIDTSGALLVADDVGNVVWRVTARQPMP